MFTAFLYQVQPCCFIDPIDWTLTRCSCACLGCDGKAGMALLIVDWDVFKIDVLSEVCRANLPVYARPLFLRIPCDRGMETTETLKHLKNDRAKEVT